MSKKKIVVFYGLFMIITLIVSGIVGRITAHSYVDDVEVEDYLSNSNLKVAYYEMGYDPDTNSGYLNNDKISNLNDLLTDNAIVVKVILNEKFQRKVYYECVLSELEILDVYEGALDKGDVISFFEPVIIHGQDKMFTTDGYNLMEENKEYILFLKELKNANYGDDKFIYAPSATRYSKYEVGDKVPRVLKEEELEEPDSLCKYEDVANQEVLLYNKSDYEKFIKLKKEVLEKYN